MTADRRRDLPDALTTWTFHELQAIAREAAHEVLSELGPKALPVDSTADEPHRIADRYAFCEHEAACANEIEAYGDWRVREALAELKEHCSARYHQGPTAVALGALLAELTKETT